MYQHHSNQHHQHQATTWCGSPWPAAGHVQVRYAEPPERWRPPVGLNASRRAKVLMADQYGSECFQMSGEGQQLMRRGGGRVVSGLADKC